MLLELRPVLPGIWGMAVWILLQFLVLMAALESARIQRNMRKVRLYVAPVGVPGSPLEVLRWRKTGPVDWAKLNPGTKGKQTCQL